MVETVNEHRFRDAFQRLRPDNFTYEGLGVLFNTLKDFEESTDEPIELDVIALCCEFTEYAHIGEFWLDYGGEDAMEEYPDIEAIEEHTIVMYITERLNTKTLQYVPSEAFIIQQF